MSVVKIVQIINLVLSSCNCIYILTDLIVKKGQMMRKKRSSINNSKYIILIVIFCLQFVFYGMMRNFE